MGQTTPPGRGISGLLMAALAAKDSFKLRTQDNWFTSHVFVSPGRWRSTHYTHGSSTFKKHGARECERRKRQAHQGVSAEATEYNEFHKKVLKKISHTPGKTGKRRYA